MFLLFFDDVLEIKLPWTLLHNTLTRHNIVRLAKQLKKKNIANTQTKTGNRKENKTQIQLSYVFPQVYTQALVELVYKNNIRFQVDPFNQFCHA